MSRNMSPSEFMAVTHPTLAAMRGNLNKLRHLQQRGRAKCRADRNARRMSDAVQAKLDELTAPPTPEEVEKKIEEDRQMAALLDSMFGYDDEDLDAFCYPEYACVA